MLEKIILLPGDEIELKRKDEKEIVIGPGLRKDNHDSIVSIKCGQLRKKENFFWVDSYQKRYVPVRNEYVIGIAVTKSAETIKVDIGSSEYASLSFLAFENATKRNKPNVEIGDLLYCRVLTGNKDMEPELVCIDSTGKANGLGVLKDGFMIKVNLELSRRLLSGSSQFLRILSKHIPPFEITIGMNGRIWIKTMNCKQTLFLVDAINQYARRAETDVEKFLQDFFFNNDE